MPKPSVVYCWKLLLMINWPFTSFVEGKAGKERWEEKAALSLAPSRPGSHTSGRGGRLPSVGEVGADRLWGRSIPISAVLGWRVQMQSKACQCVCLSRELPALGNAYAAPGLSPVWRDWTDPKVFSLKFHPILTCPQSMWESHPNSGMMGFFCKGPSRDLHCCRDFSFWHSLQILGKGVTEGRSGALVRLLRKLPGAPWGISPQRGASGPLPLLPQVVPLRLVCTRVYERGGWSQICGNWTEPQEWTNQGSTSVNPQYLQTK